MEILNPATFIVITEYQIFCNLIFHNVARSYQLDAPEAANSQRVDDVEVGQL